MKLQTIHKQLWDFRLTSPESMTSDWRASQTSCEVEDLEELQIAAETDHCLYYSEKKHLKSNSGRREKNNHYKARKSGPVQYLTASLSERGRVIWSFT